MSLAFSIDRGAGSLHLGAAIRIERKCPLPLIEPQVAGLIRRQRDFSNGYAWLDLEGLSFGAAPAWLSLCFHHAHLTEASWSVDPPGSSPAADWPTRAETDREIAFVREVLAQQIGYNLAQPAGRYAWGEVWSSYDPKADLAGHALRYCTEAAPKKSGLRAIVMAFLKR